MRLGLCSIRSDWSVICSEDSLVGPANKRFGAQSFVSEASPLPAVYCKRGFSSHLPFTPSVTFLFSSFFRLPKVCARHCHCPGSTEALS